ncbi:MAG: hypothetical protein ACI8P7_001176, partial [Candidatus Azotimanducaceae bacterium]
MRLKQLLVLLSISIVLSSCVSNNAKRAEAISGIPSSASVIVEVNRFDKLFQGVEKAGLVEIAAEDKTFTSASKALNTLSQEVLKTPETQQFFLTSPFFISLHMVGTNQQSFVFTRGLGNQAEEWANLKAQIKQNYGGTARDYDGAIIQEVTIGDYNFHIADHQNVLFISPEGVLIEDAIRQINSGMSLAQDADFKKLRSTANKKDDANIYVQYANSPDFLHEFFPSYKTAWIKDLSKWTEMDLVCKSDGFLMNGLSISSDSIHNTLTLFSDNDPQRLSLFNVAPKNTAIAVMIGVSDFAKYHAACKEQLRSQNQLMRYTKNAETIGNVAEVEANLISWVDSEIGFFVSETSKEIAQNSFAVMKTKDQQLAIKSLEHLSNNISESYRSKKIRQIAFNSLFGTILGDLFEGIKKPYYVALDEYIVFANTQANLRAIINSYLGKSTLANDQHFKQFYDHLNPKSNVFIYAKNPAASKLYHLLSETKRDKNSILSKASSAAIQFSVQGDLAYTNAFVFLKENSKTDTRINWTAQLDTSLLGHPHIITNHYSQKEEILAQDINNTLYHFNSYGQLLWKRKLEGSIMGDMHMVDIYKNKKYQFLFNSESHIYLIDRKGRNVEVFPITLKHKATLPLALFDFDKNRNYRIAQVCGNKIYYFNKKGAIVKGWEFTEASSPIAMIPQHFSAYKKDFILFPEESGKVNILSRQGKPNVEPNYNFNLSGNAFYLEKEKKLRNSKLITTGKEGQLYYIFMNDKIDVVNQEMLNPNHFFAQKENFRITYNEGILRLETTEDVFRYQFNGTPDLEFILPQNSKNAFIGAVNKTTGKIYVFDRKAELLDGFPVYGTSKFHITDLDKDGKLNLIVGSKEGS